MRELRLVRSLIECLPIAVFGTIQIFFAAYTGIFNEVFSAKGACVRNTGIDLWTSRTASECLFSISVLHHVV